MRLSELLGRPVVDASGRCWGTVHDAHLVQDGKILSSAEAALRLHGLIAGRAALGTRLGYAQRPGIGADDELKGPAPIRFIVRRLHRHAVYIPWSAVRSVDAGRIVVEAPEGGFDLPGR